MGAVATVTPVTPRARSSLTVSTTVPALAISSSKTIACLPSTSPTMSSISTWSSATRRLLPAASGRPSLRANCAGALGVADVRRDDDRVGELAHAEVVDQHRLGGQLVGRHREEAVHLLAVQRHRQQPRDARGAQQVGEEPAGDRDPRLVLLVRARVRVVRHDRRDARAPRRRAPRRTSSAARPGAPAPAAQNVWTMYTSCSRTLSPSCTSGCRCRSGGGPTARAARRGSGRSRLASAGCELPLNTLMSRPISPTSPCVERAEQPVDHDRLLAIVERLRVDRRCRRVARLRDLDVRVALAQAPDDLVAVEAERRRRRTAPARAASAGRPRSGSRAGRHAGDPAGRLDDPGDLPLVALDQRRLVEAEVPLDGRDQADHLLLADLHRAADRLVGRPVHPNRLDQVGPAEDQAGRLRAAQPLAARDQEKEAGPARDATVLERGPVQAASGSRGGQTVQQRTVAVAAVGLPAQGVAGCSEDPGLRCANV